MRVCVCIVCVCVGGGDILDLEAAALVVGAVGARHKLTELLLPRKPRLKVELACSCEVEVTRYNVHDLQ